MKTATKPARRPLTIAHVMPWSGMGGVEVATLRLVAATRERFRHVALCLADAHDLRRSFEELGIETVTYDAPAPSALHALRYYRMSRAIARQLVARGVEIVHFSDLKAAYHTSFAAVLAGCRSVCHLRVSYPTLSLRERLTLRPVSLFLFVSDEARRSFGMVVSQHKARVLYDAIEIPPAETPQSRVEVRAGLGIPRDCDVIGMIARISRQKDYNTLADAAVEVLKKHPATRFLMVGDNSLVDLNRSHYEEVMERLKRLGIADSFIFTGHRTDVPRLTAAMDVCVLCTHREGFPLSILEMMAQAKPVVATAVGGIPEIVRQGVTGTLHEHGNGVELARALCDLIEDPAKAKALGLAGYEHVRTYHSLHSFTENISVAYEDTVKPGAGA